jgi:hypothetical protein
MQVVKYLNRADFEISDRETVVVRLGEESDKEIVVQTVVFWPVLMIFLRLLGISCWDVSVNNK